jgi:23S rRNA pseudouridine1911/1915/1917 synthase
VGKEYLAITWGSPASGIIDLPVELDPSNRLRVKMRIAERDGLEARTGIDLVGSAERYALSLCRLYTGRQHQIRLHLAATGTPIVGDKLYGPDERMLARAADGELTEEDLERLELPRHALHAHRYRMRHAVTGEPLTLESPLPADLAEFWQRVSSAP